MRTSTMQAKKFSSAVAKIVLALALISVIGGTSTAPAFADDNGRHEGRERGYDRDRGERRGHDRDRWDRHDERYRGEYRSYPYVYAPPPVVYAPYPSPGIGLFFDFR